ncbi:ATP-binding protein [Comamonas faecalis]|uniref:ATP-binding protein n=1 Tax=Comamonas faecalis TaxID=1387849 RepID=A0ABP7QKH2_9BURK
MNDLFRPVIRQKILDMQAAPLPVLTPRDVWLPAVPGKALAVIGMRRAGKTSFLWQQLAQRHAQGTAREGLLYFSFEDERLAGLQGGDLDVLVEEFYRLHPDWRDQRRCTFFLDEIQVVPGWELFARRLLDTENVELFLSGSSAKLLSREVATSMRGRALEAVVAPFSLREALRHVGQEPQQSPDRLPKAGQSQLDAALERYLAEGGFPEAQGLDARSRTELLRSYVDVVLLRDVLERHNLSQPQVLRWLVQQLLGNAAGGFSINKFHADLRSRGVPVAKETLHQMLAHLEDAFLLHSVALATDSIRRQQVNPRKVYPVDTGLMALFDKSGKPNSGHALETTVLHALLRLGAQVGYVLTPGGFEVDFHAALPDGEQWLVQVCLDIGDTATLQREVRALQDAQALWPGVRCLLVAQFMPPLVDLPPGIELHRASHWLLGTANE